MGWNINSFKIKWLRRNMVFLGLYTIFIFCIIHNHNLYTEFYHEVILGWGGYDIKIPKIINCQNMAIYFKEYYSFRLSSQNPYIHIYILTIILYAGVCVLVLKRDFKVRYVIFTDVITLLIFCTFLSIIYFHGNIAAGYFPFWFDIILILILIFFRLCQYYCSKLSINNQKLTKQELFE